MQEFRAEHRRESFSAAAWFATRFAEAQTPIGSGNIANLTFSHALVTPLSRLCHSLLYLHLHLQVKTIKSKAARKARAVHHLYCSDPSRNRGKS